MPCASLWQAASVPPPAKAAASRELTSLAVRLPRSKARGPSCDSLRGRAGIEGLGQQLGAAPKCSRRHYGRRWRQSGRNGCGDNGKLPGHLGRLRTATHTANSCLRTRQAPCSAALPREAACIWCGMQRRSANLHMHYVPNSPQLQTKLSLGDAHHLAAGHVAFGLFCVCLGGFNAQVQTTASQFLLQQQFSQFGHGATPREVPAVQLFFLCAQGCEALPGLAVWPGRRGRQRRGRGAAREPAGKPSSADQLKSSEQSSRGSSEDGSGGGAAVGCADGGRCPVQDVVPRLPLGPASCSAQDWAGKAAWGAGPRVRTPDHLRPRAGGCPATAAAAAPSSRHLGTPACEHTRIAGPSLARRWTRTSLRLTAL